MSETPSKIHPVIRVLISVILLAGASMCAKVIWDHRKPDFIAHTSNIVLGGVTTVLIGAAVGNLFRHGVAGGVIGLVAYILAWALLALYVIIAVAYGIAKMMKAGPGG